MSKQHGFALAVIVSCVALAPSIVPARTILRTCRDGALGSSATTSGVRCDVDTQCDDVCSFEIPVCGASTCESQTFAVTMGTSRVERLAIRPGAAPARLVLRCRRPLRRAHCLTVTTTTTTPETTLPGHQPPPPTTSTTAGLVRNHMTSTT